MDKDQNRQTSSVNPEDIEAVKNEEAHQKKREAKKRRRMGVTGKSVFEIEKIREKREADLREDGKEE